MASVVTHNHYTKGRPHAMADPEMALGVAEMLVNGCTREEIGEAYAVTKGTVTRWKKDPRVQTHIRNLTRDRVYEITRKTDTEIQRRLADAEKLTMKELLAIRSEFLGGQMRDDAEKIDEETINEAAALLEDNPEAAQALRELLSGGARPAPQPSDE